MNPDFAIILNFKTTSDFDADFLVKTARNIGARAVMSSDPATFKEACEKYTIFLADEQAGLDLTSVNVIDTMVNNRKMVKLPLLTSLLMTVNSMKLPKSCLIPLIHGCTNLVMPLTKASLAL